MRARTCGLFPHRIRPASSPRVTSRTRCRLFSTGQWLRFRCRRRAAPGAHGCGLVIPWPSPVRCARPRTGASGGVGTLRRGRAGDCQGAGLDPTVSLVGGGIPAQRPIGAVGGEKSRRRDERTGDVVVQCGLVVLDRERVLALNYGAARPFRQNMVTTAPRWQDAQEPSAASHSERAGTGHFGPKERPVYPTSPLAPRWHEERPWALREWPLSPHSKTKTALDGTHRLWHGRHTSRAKFLKRDAPAMSLFRCGIVSRSA